MPRGLRLEEIEDLADDTMISASDVLDSIGRAIGAARGQEVFAVALCEPATRRPNLGIGTRSDDGESLFDEQGFPRILVKAAWSHLDRIRRDGGCECVEIRWTHGDTHGDIEINRLAEDHPYAIALMAQAIERHAAEAGWPRGTATRQ